MKVGVISISFSLIAIRVVSSQTCPYGLALSALQPVSYLNFRPLSLSKHNVSTLSHVIISSVTIGNGVKIR